MHAASESDITILLIDADSGLVDQDLKILSMIEKFGKPIILAINKIDLLSRKKMEEFFIKMVILIPIAPIGNGQYKKNFIVKIL